MLAGRYCVLDTETSGLFDFTRPADAEGQPRLASVAMIFCDERLDPIRTIKLLVRPEGWTMPAEAERIHGLSQYLLETIGVPVRDVLRIYAAVVNAGLSLVAHNASYDTKVMRGELRRAGLDDLYGATSAICTMKALVDVCSLPKANGRGYKWPKLTEAVRHVLKREHAGAHGALADAIACRELARWLMHNGRLPLPSLQDAT